MLYKTILLDLDDTILDFQRSEREALKKTLAARGVEPTQAHIRVYQTISEALWRDLEQGYVQRETVVLERFVRFAAYLGIEADPAAWNAEQTQAIGLAPYLMPGAEAFCAELRRQKRRLYAVSNGSGISQRMRLERSPLLPYFSGLFISAEMGVQKPDKAFFDRVFQTIGPSCRETAIVIGDSLTSDIAGAAASHLPSIWVPAQGNTRESDLPTYKVNCLAEIPPLLAEMEN